MEWLPRIEMAAVDFGAWGLRITVALIVAVTVFVVGYIYGVDFGYRAAVSDYKAGKLECKIKLHYPDEETGKP